MDSEEEEKKIMARWMREPPHGQGEYIRQIEYRQRRPLPTWPPATAYYIAITIVGHQVRYSSPEEEDDLKSQAPTSHT